MSDRCADCDKRLHPYWAKIWFRCSACAHRQEEVPERVAEFRKATGLTSEYLDEPEVEAACTPEPSTTTDLPPSFSFANYTGLYPITDRPPTEPRPEPDWEQYTTLTPSQRYTE